MGLRQSIAVALGGVAGASLRWSIAEIIDGTATIPWGVLVANVLGCLALGLLIGASGGASAVTGRVELAVGVGFCGALTTFSTFALDVARHLDDGHPARAVVYLVLSVGLGLAAFLIGRATGRATGRRTRPSQAEPSA